MTIRNKDGTLTARARKKNGRLFTNWISGTGRHHADDSLELLSPDDTAILKLTRRIISENNDIYYVARTDVMPDGSGETVFFGLLRYTDRNITEVGFSLAGGGIELMTISKWQEMDGGLRFIPDKRTIDADELLLAVGRALYRMAPHPLLEEAERSDDLRHWTSTLSPTELAEKIRGEGTEELRCARSYKLIVGLFFMSDTDRTCADHFYRLVAENMVGGVTYEEVCDEFLSHYPRELEEALRLAAEMVRSDASLPLVVTPAIPPQGTNAPLVATQDLLAEKFLAAEAKAKTEQEHLPKPKPPMPGPPGQEDSSMRMTGSGEPARLVPVQMLSKVDILHMVGCGTQPAAP